MIIRCERCSTLYELDEALLAPEGSEVQCARCRHVFTARPNSAAGQTMVGVPPVEGPGPTRPAVPARQPAEGPGQEAAAPAGGEAGRSARRTAARGGPAIYRPPPGHAPTAPMAPRSRLVRGDAIGAFENRLRWSHRWRWLAPSLAVGLVAVAVLGWLLLSGRLHVPGRHAGGVAAHGPVARPTASAPAPSPAPAPVPIPAPTPAPARPAAAPAVAPAPTSVTREPAPAPPLRAERPLTLPRKAEAPPTAPRKEPAAGAPATGGAEPATAPPDAEPPAAPQRLRPAAVPPPEPEPAQSGE